MDVRRIEDPVAFRRDAAPILMSSPGRNSLPLAVLETLQTEPHIYPQFHLWLAVSGDAPIGLAMQTEPHNIILADPLDPVAIEPLAAAVRADGHPVPGVIANVPFAEGFAGHLATATQRIAVQGLREGVWELTSVNDVPPVSGSARPAVGRDRDLIHRWFLEFAEEAMPGHHQDEDRTNAIIDSRLSGRSGGFWLWEDGEPVSFSGHTDLPGVGSRVGPVYTPPAFRGRGYATRLVAELSSARLGLGDPACFLFTDLANPTSNGIYAKIGYEKLCEAEEYALEDPASN